jgi:plasmanylethanolamine desaturase
MDAMREEFGGRPQVSVAADVTAVAAVAAGLAVLGVRLLQDVRSFADVAAATLMLALGYLAADLLTGFVHWFCDTFFDETTPLIGRSVIQSFREHHTDPLLMTRRGPLELTGSSFRAVAPLLAVWVWSSHSRPVAANAFVLTLASGAVATNLLHRWAHDAAPPAIARALHRTGLVLTSARHARHHAPPYAAAYCVTSGWLNPVCERLHVWTRARSAFRALGLPVSHDDRG